MAETWRMFAGRRGDGFCCFGSPRRVQMHGLDPVQVELTEDPEGRYWGFIHHDQPERGPVMVQPSQSMFRIQFPYGPEKAVRQGRVVRLNCRPVGGDA